MPRTPFKSRSNRADLRNLEEFDLSEIINIIRVRWRLIALITAIVTLLAALYAFLSTPVYEADALIQIQQQNPLPTTGSSSVSTSLLSELLPVAAPTDAEIQIMQSRAVLKPVIDRQHLNIQLDQSGVPIIRSLFSSYSPEQVAIDTLQVPDKWMDESLTLKAVEGRRYKLLSPSGSLILQGQVGVAAASKNGSVKILVAKLNLKPGDSVNVVRLPNQEAIHNLQQQLTAAEQGTDTGIVQLSLEGPDPIQDKRTVNAIVAQYLHENSSAMSEQARDSLDFIKKQLPQVKKRADLAEQKLTKYQVKHGVVQIDQQAQAYLQEATALQQQLSQLELNKAAVSERYKPAYPALKAIEEQITQTRSRISSLDSQIRNLPQKDQGYLTLERDAQVYEQLYTTLLAQAQDLRVTEAGAVGSARLIDNAMLPLKPVRPHKVLIIIAGLFLGFVIAMIVVLLKRALNQSIEDPEELEREFVLPVMAVIPHSDMQKVLISKSGTRKRRRIPVLALEAPNDVTVEALQSLKTSLAFGLSGVDRKIVTFGGASPDVGKSFLSVNVAHLMGKLGARSLVIDADLRRGHVHRYFGERWSPGLSEYLLGEVKRSEVLRQSPNSDYVHFVASGEFPSNPLELVSSARMTELLDHAAQEYEYVFIDIPPVLAVADALPIARQATANLLVVKAGVQTVPEVRFALDRLTQNGVEVRGFILNDFGGGAGAYAGARYSYAYAYKYKNRRR